MDQLTPSPKQLVSFTVPGRPQAKQRVRTVRATGLHYTPERTVSYEGLVAYAGAEAMRAAGIPGPVSGALSVRVQVCMPIAASWSLKKRQQARDGELRPTGKPDLDNLGKILDALNMVVWGDDAQIVYLVLSKVYADNPGMTITVHTL
jgi:Holliday junction resolvase RusA-like endonuclease